MATLLESLLMVLKEECDTYDKLLVLSRSKAPVIIKGDLEALNSLTDEEQEYVDIIAGLERKRQEATKDIANVLNRDVASLTLGRLAELLASRPEEQRAILEIRQRLGAVVDQLREINAQNAELLKNSLEMVEFEMNLIQSMKTAPETANYSKGAYNTGDTMGIARGGFDAKQ